MAKAPEKKAELVSVVLLCSYSGFKSDPAIGDTIEVDATEADRLIALGAATLAGQ